MPIVDNKEIEILFSSEEIAQRNQEIAREISQQDLYQLLVVPILKGAFVFAADLVRALHEQHVVCNIEFITVSSYGAGKESKEIKILQDLTSDVKGRDILLIDDILESGRTLEFVVNLLKARGARRVFVAVLLDKTARRKAKVHAQFVGFPCPDKFVVGYGMDCGHAFRQLPYIGSIVEDHT